MILLDTNVVVALMNDRSDAVRSTFDAHSDAGHALGISSIVVFELEYGIARSARPRENAAMLKQFLTRLCGVVDFDAHDAAIAGRIRASLNAAGTPIGPYDVLIAAQALRRDATLVTANTREFSRIEGLKVADWGKG